MKANYKIVVLDDNLNMVFNEVVPDLDICTTSNLRHYIMWRFPEKYNIYGDLYIVQEVDQAEIRVFSAAGSSVIMLRSL